MRNLYGSRTLLSVLVGGVLLLFVACSTTDRQDSSSGRRMNRAEDSARGGTLEESSSTDCQRRVFNELDSLRAGMRSDNPHLKYGTAIASASDVPIEQITDHLRMNAFGDVLGQAGVRMSSTMTLSTMDSTQTDEDYSARLESVISQEASSFLPGVIQSEMVQCSDWYGMIIGVDVDSFRENLVEQYENEYYDIIQSEDASPVERLSRLILLGTVMSDAMLSNLPFPSVSPRRKT
ncbi:MAG: hypothetical protein PF795_08075 [Kiritimatiellae bacterium]|jgi:hypothetical protein|nr:hypothetical protein [Kiritimatiellia bacterium]